MKNNSVKILVWALRIIVSVMFIISAFSKMLPAGTALDLFAKQIVDIGVTNWCYAPLLARAIEDRRVDARELQALRAKAGEVADAMDSALEAAARDRGAEARPRARRPR